MNSTGDQSSLLTNQPNQQNKLDKSDKLNEKKYKITSTAVAVGGSVDSGKCFGKGTEILLYDGNIKKVEDIVIGDELIGDDSKKRIVLETHKGFSELYEIIPKNGEKCVVNKQHILCLKNNNESDKIVEISVENFLELSEESQNCLKWYSTSVEFDDKLNNKSNSNFYMIGNRLKNIIEVEKKYNCFSELLSIPIKFKCASKEQRMSFLLALMNLGEFTNFDNSKVYNICISKIYKKLATDIIFIINSLGYTLYNDSQLLGLSETNNDELTISFSTLEKKENFTINFLGNGEYYGFQVTDNGRFLLKDFSVVHNSSLVGILTSPNPILDDGNGSARKIVAKHPHEIASGRTSDISSRVCNLQNSTEAITLVDLCGHETYFKTTTFGVSGHFPDYGFLIVSANRGILPMTKQHMRLFLSLSIPFVIIITHSDMATNDVYQRTTEGITKTCSMFCGKMVSTVFVNNLSDQENTNGDMTNNNVPINDIEYNKKIQSVKTVLNAIKNISDGKQLIFPVITMSSKTGFYLDVIKTILSSLSPRNFWLQCGENDITENRIVKQFKISLEKQQEGLSSILPQYKEFTGGIFYIDSSYNVPGIGIVVTGINRGTNIVAGSQNYMYIGPFGKEFKKIRIKSLHNNMREVVPFLENHHRGCINFALVDKGELKREHIGKGIVVIPSLEMTKNICYRFRAVITMFSNSTTSITLKTGYSPVIHLNTVRQTARMILDPRENNNQEVITFDGKNTTVVIATFKFKCNPEFVEPYNKFLLRSGSIQGIGLVIGITPISDDNDAKPDPVKLGKFRRKIIPKNK